MGQVADITPEWRLKEANKCLGDIYLTAREMAEESRQYWRDSDLCKIQRLVNCAMHNLKEVRREVAGSEINASA